LKAAACGGRGEGWPLAVGFGSAGGKEVGGDRGVGEREKVRGDKGSQRYGGKGCGLVRLGDGEDHVWFGDRWMVASLCDE
jgi:hypothetical protein